jgi:Fe2+ or Zn2+ uptake regulation protein
LQVSCIYDSLDASVSYKLICMDKKKEYKQLLHDVGLKATNSRIYVLNFFDDVKRPVCVKDIDENINCIDNVTIYRIVDIFLQKGIVRAVHVCGDSRFFELAALPHHHHIICKECGMIEDINNCNLKKVIKEIEKGSCKFNSITEHTFELFGICKECK